jgi:hypothetical protein
VEQEQGSLQPLYCVGGQKNPLNRRPAVAVENELVHPAESGRVLVLLADRLLENVDFSVASLLR